MIDFLLSVWPETMEPLYGEIRVIRNGQVDHVWVDVLDPFSLMEAQSNIAHFDEEGWDVYYGVLLRDAERKGDAAHTVDRTDVLWADIDAKAMPTAKMLMTDGGKQEAFHRLSDVVPAPSIIVDSGNGYHGYWLLTQPVEFRVAQAIMVGIAKDIGADAVYDQPRILRVPGTFNHKDPQRPVPVRIVLKDESRRYRPGAFADYRDAGFDFLSPPQARRDPTAFEGLPEQHVAQGGLPGWLSDLIREGAPKGERSEVAFKVVLWMLRYGASDAEIEAAFARFPDGIGSKFFEKGGPGSQRAHKWLAYTIRAAKEVA